MVAKEWRQPPRSFHRSRRRCSRFTTAGGRGAMRRARLAGDAGRIEVDVISRQPRALWSHARDVLRESAASLSRNVEGPARCGGGVPNGAGTSARRGRACAGRRAAERVRRQAERATPPSASHSEHATVLGAGPLVPPIRAAASRGFDGSFTTNSLQRSRRSVRRTRRSHDVETVALWPTSREFGRPTQPLREHPWCRRC